jgi:hypothetical protein
MEQLISEHINAAKNAGLNGTADFIKQLADSQNKYKEDLIKERSKNAFIACTGKSMKGIWSDGIINAVEHLCPDFNYKEDSLATVQINELINYSIKLAHQ